ncbi:MAG: hypothetical protein ACKOYK_10735 [Cyanobium sp.]
MPWNSLLFALVGGFLFDTLWNRTKYNARRVDGQRLLLQSALWGVLLLILSYLIIRWISLYAPGLQQWWQSLVIYRGLSVPLLAMVLGGTLPWLLNLFWREDLQNLKSYKRFSDFFGAVLYQAQLDNNPVLIDLRNGKSYVGKVIECNTPGHHDKSGSVLLQPLLSGYRSDENHELVLTTDYATWTSLIVRQVEQALDEAKNERDVVAEANKRLAFLQIAVFTADISTVRPFNHEIYTLFNRPTLRPGRPWGGIRS